MMENCFKIDELNEETIKMTKFFLPTHIEKQFPKKPSFPNLTIAAIISEPLYYDLLPECTVMPLSENDACDILQYASPELVLIESTWESVTGDWSFAMTEHSTKSDMIEKVLDLAKRKNIPTVFWFTKDHHYIHHFLQIIKKFDFIYCSEPISLEILKFHGISAELLLPAIQPNIFHPFRQYQPKKKLEIDLLYDGWVDILNGKELNQLLEHVNPEKLSIIQSESRLKDTMIPRSNEKLRENIKGYVPRYALPTILRHTTTYLASEEQILSTSKKVRKILEAAACYCSIIYHTQTVGDDFITDIGASISEVNEVLIEIERLEQDHLYQQARAHIGWRTVFNEHTIAHRLQTIIRDLNLAHRWEEYPTASLIATTFRREQLYHIIKQYEYQTYPNKELIIVFNGEENQIINFREEYKGREDIKITSIYKDYYAGACLNYGINIARGEYVFRFDDDDFYGPNYLLDTMLAFRAIDAKMSGKEFKYFRIDNENCFYSPNIKNTPPTIFTANHLTDSNIGLFGCTLGGEKQFFLNRPYSNNIVGAADRELISNIRKKIPDTLCLCLDQFNFVYRSSDIRNHTWQIESEILKSNARYMSDSLYDFMI